MMQNPHRSAGCSGIVRRAALGLSVLALAATLSACEGGLGGALGLDKKAPDEFAVVRSTPLTLPPDFTLRPPRPGEAGPSERSLREQARDTLLSDSGAPAPDDAAATPTQGEAAFIERAGAADIDPNIRHLVDREFSGLASEDESFVDSLLFWREEAPPGDVVDAEAEAERLRENIEAGRPVTAGETPTIKRREKALLEGVF